MVCGRCGKPAEAAGLSLKEPATAETVKAATKTGHPVWLKDGKPWLTTMKPLCRECIHALWQLEQSASSSKTTANSGSD